MFPIFNHPAIGIPPDDSWRTLKVRDRARVRAHVPIYGGNVGTLTEMTDGMYSLAFDGGGSCVFDGDDLMAVKKQKKTFTYEETWADQLSATDLVAEFEAHSGENIHAFLIMIEGEVEKAEALYLEDEGRMGISWGADATWADVESVEAGIEMWLNDGEQWNQRN